MTEHNYKLHNELDSDGLPTCIACLELMPAPAVCAHRIKQLPIVQMPLNTQLAILYIAATKLGLNNAADYLLNPHGSTHSN